MRYPVAVSLACIAVAGLGPGAARADSAVETRLREALRSTTSQFRSLEDERAKWQSQDAELRKELESLRKQVSARPAAAKGSDRKLVELDRRLSEQTEANSALKDANGKLTESLSQCEKTTRDATETVRVKEDERTRLAAQVNSLTERLSASEAKNERLFSVGKEILKWALRDDISETGQTVLGLERVKLENAAQDYEDKLLEQKVKP
jgi:chromosome segregation ATPase